MRTWTTIRKTAILCQAILKDVQRDFRNVERRDELNKLAQRVASLNRYSGIDALVSYGTHVKLYSAGLRNGEI